MHLLEAVLKQAIEISRSEVSLRGFMAELEEIDKLLYSFEDEYVELELSTFMFCTFFVRVFKEVSQWSFDFETLEKNRYSSIICALPIKWIVFRLI